MDYKNKDFHLKALEAQAWKVTGDQCDHMMLLLIQYLANYNNEHTKNLPKAIKMAKVGSKFGQR